MGSNDGWLFMTGAWFMAPVEVGAPWCDDDIDLLCMKQEPTSVSSGRTQQVTD
jgi:hypothetical protein